MKSLKQNYCITNYCSLFIITCLLNSTLLNAQSSVLGLRLNNQTVASAKVNVFAPGNGGNRPEIKTGEQLISGTRLIIPPNTIVLLQSPGGKQKLQSLTGKAMEYTVEISGKGENHTVQGTGASIENTVNKLVGHDYKANNGRGSIASSHGTVFTFTDYTQGGKEQAKIKTDEGSISITDAQPVKINGTEQEQKKHSRAITQSVSKMQAAGDAEFTTTNKAIEYDSPEQAIEAISGDMNMKGDDESADDLMALGDIFLEINQPDKAIQPYRSALKFYQTEYGEDDLTTLEAKLALADALLSTENEGYKSEANTLAAKAITLLEEVLADAQDDLSYVTEENDHDATALICDDIADMYELLGYGYDIAGDEAKSNEYYDKSDNGCE